MWKSKLNYNYIQHCLSQIRLMSTSNKPKNHYESLGVSKGSTQGEIKSAYYKLSMVYHPDKNPNDAASSQKFRDITAAYEVLGNVKTRKLYDRGLYMGSMGHAPTEQEPVDKFYKSRENRSKPPTPTGRTPIYDFDEWSKNHYGATFKKQQENREKARMYQIHRQMHKEHGVKTDTIFFMFALLTLVSYEYLWYVTIKQMFEDFEKDHIEIQRSRTYPKKDI
ncbi:unnamed protein product [Acanthoscelides obtectus]|uniref:J domain-containing protein n=1 Tax=Acanthoscelides obtectus TaxID=200917 RepID=A0A9P0JXJ4_ACAOB|nr:unnamed protein product [Acanthoscelides obtectus]CAK1639048.1 Chaperone protein DnaJ [Acanthoscelides obtectus]